ncbi:MAG: hypothetical protein AB7F82_09500, partial [Alphaproteobacteria bacterium]
QLRSAVEESQFYTQALKNFQDKYGELPGDFTKATSIWGAQHATPATCVTTVTNLEMTCNGDGDGWITNQATSATYYEQFRAWQQLNLAGFIPVSVTPITSAGGTQARTVGYNIPASKLDGAGWGLVAQSIYQVTVVNTTFITYYANDIPPNHVLILGGSSISGYLSSSYQSQRITPSEAKGIDEKIDDGLPRLGRLVVQTNPAPTTACHSSDTAFNVSNNDPICTLVFKTGL